MADRISFNQRSLNMSKIRGKDTTIEVKVRKYLYNHGFRYRKNFSSLPGKPDIYLSKYKTVIFVNGCFWHQHENCRLATMPKSNVSFWYDKLSKNVYRDKNSSDLLINSGYKVIIIWECELKNDFELKMKSVIDQLLTHKE